MKYIYKEDIYCIFKRKIPKTTKNLKVLNSALF